MSPSPLPRPRPARTRLTTALALAVGLVAALALTACGAASQAEPSEQSDTLRIGAIPDQDPAVLRRLNGQLADYLSGRLDTKVEYVPVTDYTAAVTAFRVGDLDLVWFGGLTGVQARLQVPGAEPLAQRDIDSGFRTVFVAGTDSGIEPFDRTAQLRRLAGHTFTFGSQTSTSGRLMPQYFLEQAGVQADRFRGRPGFSGSHDATIDLVEAGSFEAGAVNEQVWDDRLAEGSVNTRKVEEVWRTPPYQDYHWLARPDVDERLGAGTTDRIREALLGLDMRHPSERRILDMFGARAFIPTQPSNYAMVERAGRELGLVRSP
jgi:phosphonate transport system substrate-binding protein